MSIQIPQSEFKDQATYENYMSRSEAEAQTGPSMLETLWPKALGFFFLVSFYMALYDFLFQYVVYIPYIEGYESAATHIATVATVVLGSMLILWLLGMVLRLIGAFFRSRIVVFILTTSTLVSICSFLGWFVVPKLLDMKMSVLDRIHMTFLGDFSFVDATTIISTLALSFLGLIMGIKIDKNRSRPQEQESTFQVSG